MEISNKIKARIFANSFEQVIEWVDPDGDEVQTKLLGVIKTPFADHDNQYKLITYWNGQEIKLSLDKAKLIKFPLSQITKEDKMEVARLVCYRRAKAIAPEEINYEIRLDGKIHLVNKFGASMAVIEITKDGVSFSENSEVSLGREFYAPNQYAITNYLESKNYALTCEGLTVDELVETGIYKLEPL